MADVSSSLTRIQGVRGILMDPDSIDVLADLAVMLPYIRHDSDGDRIGALILFRVGLERCVLRVAQSPHRYGN